MIYDRNGVGHTGQDAAAAAIGGEAMAQCVIKSGAKGGSIVFPNTTTLGNVEVNNRVKAAFEATVKALKTAVDTVPIGSQQVKGRATPVIAYKIVCRDSMPPAAAPPGPAGPGPASNSTSQMGGLCLRARPH